MPPSKHEESDHDILIEIRSELKAHSKAFDEHKTDFKIHKGEDCLIFERFEKRLLAYDNLMIRATTIISFLFTIFVGIPKIYEFFQHVNHFINKN